MHSSRRSRSPSFRSLSYAGSHVTDRCRSAGSRVAESPLIGMLVNPGPRTPVLGGRSVTMVVSGLQSPAGVVAPRDRYVGCRLWASGR